MKTLLLLFSLFSLVFNQENSTNNQDETYGCIIPERKSKCCWRNSNGCCSPPLPERMCSMAFTDCCKTKVYDEENGTYKYEFSLSSIILEFNFSLIFLFILLLI